MRGIWAVMAVLTLCGCESRHAGVEDSRKAAAQEKSVVQVSAVRKAESGHYRGTSATNRPKSTARSLSSAALRQAVRATTCPLVQVSGHVLFEDGTPLTDRVSSSTVELWRDASIGAPDGDSLDGARSGDQRLDVCEIGEKGGYRVAGPDLGGLRVEVRGVSRAIAAVAGADVKTTEPRIRNITQNFLIPAPHKITGRVVDSHDQPVTSAIVSLRSEDVKTDGWYYGNQQTTVTAAGEFTLDGVAAGPGMIGAAAPGYSPMTQEISAPTSGIVTLRLTTGTVTLRGNLLLFPTDVPVAGASVKIQPKGKPATLGLTQSAPEARTAADGSFAFQNLPAGQQEITIRDPAGQTLYPAPGKANQAAFAPTLIDGQTTAATLRVFRGYTITGQVFDQDTSEPLSGADVVAFESRKKETHATSDESGRYKMENVGDPSGEVAARLEGYAISQKGQFSYSQNQFVIRQTLPENSDVITADIPMVPIVHVSGRVENQDGLPVGGAKVEWVSSLTNGSSGEAVNSNSDGQFRFQVLPFQEGIVQVTAPGYAFKRSDAIRISTKDVNDIVIVLGPGASVSGRVVSPTGEGVPDARVTLNRGFYSMGGNLRSDTTQERSGVDGQFFVENLAPAEKLELRASADDFAPGSTTIAVEAGEHKTGVEIKLKESFSIEGRVVDSDDKPVIAYVVPDPSGVSNSAKKTDANGHFKITGLPKGQTTLYAQSEDAQQSKSATAEAGAKDVIIRLDEKNVVTVHGRVVDGATQRPIEDFTVTGARKEARDGEGPGGFRFSASPKYTTFLRIASRGYVTQGFEVKVDQDQQEVHKTFALGIGSGVTGRIVNSDGKPIPSTAVVVYDQRPYQKQGDMVGNSISGEDGRFTISKVPAGKVRVAAMPGALLAPVYKQVELKDGEFTDVGDMVIEQLGAIHVTVVRGAAEEPMTGQMVYLNGTGALTEYRVVNTGADGTANFDKLSPGTYELKVASHIERVELASGESKSVVMRLGNVQLTGKVLTSGKAEYNTLQLRQVESGYTTKNFVGTNYTVPNLPPGDYEATIFEGMDRSYDDTNTSAPKMLHQERFNIPDQPTVTKDFIVP